MNKYTLDVEKSKEVYEYFQEQMQLKMCYNNVYSVFEYSIATFRTGKWKIAYGYVSSIENILCRHCFIIDENGKVIDPTLFTQTIVNTEREYYVFKIYDDVDEYLDAIVQNDYYVGLERVLRKEERQAHEWALNNGYFLAG